MSTFVYYNPKTNTIERRFPAQPASFQVPYLLNIQPEDLNYAIYNTSQVRSGPGVQESSHLDQKNDYEYKILEPLSLSKQFEKEKENKSSNIPSKPEIFSKNSAKNYPKETTNEFLMIEDLHEEDLPSLPQYSQFNKAETRTNKKKTPKKIQNTETVKLVSRRHEIQESKQLVEQEEEEDAKGNFNLMRQEDLILKFKPEDYSMNERILNAKFVAQEQERTKKFILDRIGNDINEMERQANLFEKEIQSSELETNDLEEKTKKIWEEIERKKFEMKAKQILNNIDHAIEIKDDSKQNDRITSLFQENQALYDEIDKVLENDGEDQYSLFTRLDTGISKNNVSEIRKPTSTGVRSIAHKSYANKANTNILDQKLGRKNIVKTISEEKTKGATRVYVANPKKGAVNTNKKDFAYKNPKKVEEALQKAKQIADLY